MLWEIHKQLKPMPTLQEVTEEFLTQGMVITRAGEAVMLVQPKDVSDYGRNRSLLKLAKINIVFEDYIFDLGVSVQAD